MAKICQYDKCKEKAHYLIIYTTQIPRVVITAYSCNIHLMSTIYDAITFREAIYVGVHKL